DFVDRWSEQNVAPLIVPTPSEGELTRSMNGSRITGKNMPVWREKKGSSAFLLRFGSGHKTEIWSCELKKSGILARINRIEKHEALGNLTIPRAKNYGWDGQRLTVKEADHQSVTYEVPMQRRYMPPPALAANLGEQTRVVA